MKVVNKVVLYSKALYHILLEEARDAEHLTTPIGWLGFIGFPAYFYIWKYMFPQPYENLPLRIIGGLLCLGLLLKRYWPKQHYEWFYLYWLFSMLYSLPFFFSFFLLKNHFSTIQLMSSLAALFILIMIFDWVSQVLLFVVGITCGWIAYAITTPFKPTLLSWHYSYLGIYVFALIIGMIFTHRKKEVQRKKLEGMVTISTTVAHELRTPLLGIKSGIQAIDKYLPALFEAYHLAAENNLPVKKIRRTHLHNLSNLTKRLVAETNYSNTIIDILMMNVRQPEINKATFTSISMCHCIEEALTRYPFNSLEERNKIHFSASDDFYFYGSDILMIHVLFNLLKNALHFIHKNKKGSVFIKLKKGHKANYLFFEDTGIGIPENELPKLFKLFYTTTLTGTGIGLAFSKKVIDAFGAKISVQSNYNEYTIFTIRFPIATLIEEDTTLDDSD